MSEKDEDFRAALQGKNIPILTLDNKWHKLFTQTGASDKMKSLEEELNTLLKRQGKLNTESKSIHALKTKLMKEIVDNMEASDQGSQKASKKMDETKRLIEECNEKLDAYQDELLELPKQIADVNYQLMLETMQQCYAQIQANVAEIDATEQWIQEIKEKLKKRLMNKQQKEIWNQQLYKYMHETFGSEVIDLFDLKYNRKQQKQQETTNTSN